MAPHPRLASGLAVCLCVLSSVAGARELPSSREAAALAPPVLHVEPAGIAFEVQAGDDMPTRTLTIANRGGQTLSWSISPPPTLRVTPSSGEVGHGKSMKISVSPVAAALPDEDQQYDLQVDAPGGQGGPGSVKVDLIIIPPDPEIQVTAPDTGSQWEVGSLQTVVWSTVGEVAGPLGVELSTDGGLTWKPIGRASVDARGARLKTPASPSTQCRVRVRDASGDVSGTSEQFTIAAAPPPEPPEPPDDVATEPSEDPDHRIDPAAQLRNNTVPPPEPRPMPRGPRFGVHAGALMAMGTEQDDVKPGGAINVEVRFPRASNRAWVLNGGLARLMIEEKYDTRSYDSLVLSFGGEHQWMWNADGGASPYVLLGAGMLLEQTEPNGSDTFTNGVGAANIGAGIRVGRVDVRAAYSALLGSDNAGGLTSISLGYRF